MTGIQRPSLRIIGLVVVFLLISKWSEISIFPLSLCFANVGFCGVTKEISGDKPVKNRTCSRNGTLSRVVGYYEGCGTRRTCNRFWPEQISGGVYSHINFAFATIDPGTYEVLPSDQADVSLYERLTDLKRWDPRLKVLIALGGWTFNKPGPTATAFSEIAASEEKQKKFFKSLISFMSTYGFDGVDLDWEYPGAVNRGGRPEDYGNFPKFIANLKSTLLKTPDRFELSITLPYSDWYLRHFDLTELEKHVSFFNLVTYDMHGTLDRGNKWTGEQLNAHTNLTEIKDSLDLLWRKGVDAENVVMGLAFYGRGYTVASPSCVEPGCLFLSGSVETHCYYETGVLPNNDIVRIMRAKGLSSKLYEDAAVKVTHWRDQWVSYDDEETLKIKTDFAREQCLGGVNVWAISHDMKYANFTEALYRVANRRGPRRRHYG